MISPESLKNNLENLNLKITDFQRQILALKDELKKSTEDFNSNQKGIYIELIEWMDHLNLILEDINSNEPVNKAQVNKSATRLQSRMDRFFKARGIGKIASEGSVDMSPGTKVIETRACPTLESGCIIEVIRDGYYWHEQILRKQEVIAAT